MPALRVPMIELLRRDARGHNPDMPAYLFFPVALLVLMMASGYAFFWTFQTETIAAYDFVFGPVPQTVMALILHKYWLMVLGALVLGAAFLLNRFTLVSFVAVALAVAAHQFGELLALDPLQWADSWHLRNQQTYWVFLVAVSMALRWMFVLALCYGAYRAWACHRRSTT
jgi:hypothetical protein